jgi:hypothetical protein
MTSAGQRGDVDAAADVEAIKRLKARYFRYVDQQLWAELRTLFTDDASISFEFPPMEFAGPDAFVAASIEGLAGARTVHHGHMPEIELVAHHLARGVWAMDDLVERPIEVGSSWHGYGHYHEEYRKTAGEWRIASLRLTRVRVDEFTPTPPDSDH